MQGDCPFCLAAGPAGPGTGPNVRWSAKDSLTVCPAGDSVVVVDPLHVHPSRVRIGVEYFDDACGPRLGVPPDSIWVTYGSTSVVVNDQRTQVFADEPTDGCGFARITIPSLSGCGTLSVSLYVSGVFQGSKLITVRTTDKDADGRSTLADQTQPLCDLNYDGHKDALDVDITNAHRDHWKRHALHGTLVQLTEHCDNCGVGGLNTVSPEGRIS